MFTTVKNLTTYIDNTIGYIVDAHNSRDKHENEVMIKYMIDMNKRLDGQLDNLKHFSSNDRLINRYQNKIDNIKNEIISLYVNCEV